MIIECYIICWNEIDTIDLTLMHYSRFCDIINVFDNWSDDGTFERCKKFGCNVQRFGIQGVLDDSEYLKIKNHCWKNSSADYVIVVDCDEIIFHPQINTVLENAIERRDTIIPTVGWNIYSNDMPEQSYLEITRGVPDDNYSKKAVFSPVLKEINYVFGCHVAQPTGRIQESLEKVYLLHYRNIGGVDRLLDRHRIYRQRLSQRNKRFGLGIHYTYPDERRIQEWNAAYNSAMELSAFNSAGVV